MKPNNFLKVVSTIRKTGLPDDVKEIARTFINQDKMDSGQALKAAFKLSGVEPNKVQKYALDLLANPNALNVASWMHGAPKAYSTSKGMSNRLVMDDMMRKDVIKSAKHIIKPKMKKGELDPEREKQLKILEAANQISINRRRATPEEAKVIIKTKKQELATSGNTLKQLKILQALGLVD